MKDRKHGLACQIKLMPNVNAKNLKIPFLSMKMSKTTLFEQKSIAYCYIKIIGNQLINQT